MNVCGKSCIVAVRSMCVSIKFVIPNIRIYKDSLRARFFTPI